MWTTGLLDLEARISNCIRFGVEIEIIAVAPIAVRTSTDTQTHRVKFFLPHYPLPITHYPLPITHYPLPITHSLFPVPCSL
ncbi:MAG TPA: hypothetical protein V6D21_19300 [Candidatus Obscuribacterales bacterium]